MSCSLADVTYVVFLVVRVIEKRDWINLDKDSAKVAIFCSKSQSDGASAETVAVGAASDASICSGAQTVDVLLDEDWLKTLRAGSLVDCKDKGNTWYQVQYSIVQINPSY